MIVAIVGRPVRTLTVADALNGLILPISLGAVAASMAAMGVWSLATQISLLFR